MDFVSILCSFTYETGRMTENNASKTVIAGSTTYFFDIQETKGGKPYLVITERRFRGEGSERQRSSIVVFPEQIKEFISAAQEMKAYWGRNVSY
jgi:hypothetical protein